MRKLEKIKNFDDFTEYYLLNEGLGDGSQSICNQAFINGGPITFANGVTVQPKEIVNAVETALGYLSDEYHRTFQFGNCLNIIYLAHSKKYKTMAVDDHMNLYMNAGFIYNTLKMDKHLIAAVIMHEIFHILFNHIERGKNWLGAQGKAITKATWRDNNLAADVEVNQTLVRLGIIDENRLINAIHGLYLFNASGETGTNTNTVPMEVILENEKYMNKLRSMACPEDDPEKQRDNKVVTAKEWDKGYKKGWNKMAGLIKKYGYKAVWDKLIEAGIINGVGELDMSKNLSDIIGLEYLQVKSMDDFLNESLKYDGEGKTEEDGYISAVSKIIEKLRNAVLPGDDDDSQYGDDENEDENEGGEYVSTINPDELTEVDIPQPKGKKGKGNGGDGLPENMKPQPGDNEDERDGKEGKEGKDDSNSQKSKSAGKGGKGKSDDEITDDDLNKLADDLKKKMGGEKNGGEKNQGQSQEEDSGAIGGTGSFIPESGNDEDEILKDAGYSDEDIKAVREIREANKERNSPAGIEKARQELRNHLSKGSAIGQMLEAIDVESEKYKNVWKEVMEKFMAKKTRRAGTKVNDTSINWKRKSRIALGQVGPQYQKVDQDPQDINVLVDVSGSMDLKLLEIICKSLVIFSKEYKYSGINICPWASKTNGVYKVDGFNKRSEDEVTDEILKVISKGSAQCGGGTDANALAAAMTDAIATTLADKNKKRKDDVNVVITDGQFDYKNIEKLLTDSVKSEIGRNDTAEKACENTFWMIYDAPDNLQNAWKGEIKKGKLIFINSEIVKNNK